MVNDSGDGARSKAEILLSEKGRQRMSMGAAGGMISDTEMPSALNMLVKAGEEFIDLAMRADFPSPQYMIACAHGYAECIEFGYVEGAQEILAIVAGLTAVKGRRIDKMVQAITGDKEMRESRSVGDWIRRKAGFNDG